MITGELRGGKKPSLDQALGWIGSRVDDVYGASVGRLEDVWIDPGTGAPKWLLIKEGRFGGRTTLIPFEDATAGAGNVWIPYERELVRDAPEVEPGTPLTQQLEGDLRTHFARVALRGGSSRSEQQPQSPQQQPQSPPASREAEPPISGSTAGMFTGERPGGEVRITASAPAATPAIRGADQPARPHAEPVHPPQPPAPVPGAPPHPTHPRAPSPPPVAPERAQHRPFYGGEDGQRGAPSGAWNDVRSRPQSSEWPSSRQPHQRADVGPSAGSDDSGRSKPSPAFESLDGSYEVEFDINGIKVSCRLQGLRLRRIS